ncbi:MAG: histidinol phosphate phosphatase domain-containing protein [Thermodesulfobacteriota bacterium]
MLDLHTHSLFSDGELLPAELVRRVEVLGYEAVAITDHADSSNLEIIVPSLARLAAELAGHTRTRLIPGVEITHVPPGLFGQLVSRARALGARIVVGHGETPVEPVAPGTNLAAIEAGVDLLAHPGFISEEEVRLAVSRGVFLEISGRKGHSLTNGHVARLAVAAGARLAVCADGHAPGDFLTPAFAETVALGAGLTREHYLKLRRDMAALAAGR